MDSWINLVLTGDVRVVAGLVAGGLAGLGSGVTVGKIFGNWTLNRRLAEADKQLSGLKGSLEDSVHLEHHSSRLLARVSLTSMKPIRSLDR